MSETGFTAKERVRFRKLLEVAQSTTYEGERDAAMQAAKRLAASHGMSLREAAGMADAKDEPQPAHRQRPRRAHGFAADFGAAAAENVGAWWQHPRHAGRTPPPHSNVNENARMEAEKKRHDEAMQDAILRGLDAEERAAAERAAQRRPMRPRKNGSWRARPEFIRVLLTETGMTAKEIAAAAGVTVYDVFKEKLLMRRPSVVVGAP